jgi:hypothetical protein
MWPLECELLDPVGHIATRERPYHLPYRPEVRVLYAIRLRHTDLPPYFLCSNSNLSMHNTYHYYCESLAVLP